MNVSLLEVAQQELDEAVSYYNGQVAGLGDAFLLEVVAAIERIRRFPSGWHPLGENFRRCRLRRFSYGLIYQADKNEILVVAVAHSHRRPSRDSRIDPGANSKALVVAAQTDAGTRPDVAAK